MKRRIGSTIGAAGATLIAAGHAEAQEPDWYYEGAYTVGFAVDQNVGCSGPNGCTQAPSNLDSIIDAAYQDLNGEMVANYLEPKIYRATVENPGNTVIRFDYLALSGDPITNSDQCRAQYHPNAGVFEITCHPDTLTCSDTSFLPSVMRHELWHPVGIGDSSVAGSMMYGEIRCADTSYRPMDFTQADWWRLNNFIYLAGYGW